MKRRTRKLSAKQRTRAASTRNEARARSSPPTTEKTAVKRGRGKPGNGKPPQESTLVLPSQDQHINERHKRTRSTSKDDSSASSDNHREERINEKKARLSQDEESNLVDDGQSVAESEMPTSNDMNAEEVSPSAINHPIESHQYADHTRMVTPSKSPHGNMHGEPLAAQEDPLIGANLYVPHSPIEEDEVEEVSSASLFVLASQQDSCDNGEDDWSRASLYALDELESGVPYDESDSTVGDIDDAGNENINDNKRYNNIDSDNNNVNGDDYNKDNDNNICEEDNGDIIDKEHEEDEDEEEEGSNHKEGNNKDDEEDKGSYIDEDSTKQGSIVNMPDSTEPKKPIHSKQPIKHSIADYVMYGSDAKEKISIKERLKSTVCGIIESPDATTIHSTDYNDSKQEPQTPLESNKHDICITKGINHSEGFKVYNKTIRELLLQSKFASFNDEVFELLQERFKDCRFWTKDDGKWKRIEPSQLQKVLSGKWYNMRLKMQAEKGGSTLKDSTTEHRKSLRSISEENIIRHGRQRVTQASTTKTAEKTSAINDSTKRQGRRPKSSLDSDQDSDEGKSGSNQDIAETDQATVHEHDIDTHNPRTNISHHNTAHASATQAAPPILSAIEQALIRSEKRIQEEQQFLLLLQNMRSFESTLQERLGQTLPSDILDDGEEARLTATTTRQDTAQGLQPMWEDIVHKVIQLTDDRTS
jgi:hypothetical protein